MPKFKIFKNYKVVLRLFLPAKCLEDIREVVIDTRRLHAKFVYFYRKSKRGHIWVWYLK